MFSADTVRRLGPTKDADCGCGGDCGPCSANFGLGVHPIPSGSTVTEASVMQLGATSATPAGSARNTLGSTPWTELRPPEGPLANELAGGEHRPISWWYYEDGANIEVREPCTDDGPPYFELPSVLDVHSSVRECMLLAHGTRTTWPSHDDCCDLSSQAQGPKFDDPRPELTRSRDCPVITLEQGLRAEAMLTARDNRHAEDAGGQNATTPSPAMRAMVGAGIHMLLANIDIVQWVWCRIRDWTPDSFERWHDANQEFVNVGLEERYVMRTVGFVGGFPVVTFDDWYWSCLEGLLRLRAGTLGWHVTWVDKSASSGNEDALAWAFSYAGNRVLSDASVGVIWPTEHDDWIARAIAFKGGGPEALCAASQVASVILHELVHVCAGGSGGRHKDFQHDEGLYAQTCWDEPRMAATMFRWAIVKRYPCILDAVDCGNYSDLSYFARSEGTYRQLFAVT